MIAELLFALVIGLLVASLFAFGMRRPGPWGGFLWFFLLVFLGAWAIGAWIPAGPMWIGVAWVPILIGALLVALLVAAFPEPRAAVPPEQHAADTAAAATLGVFFWILVLGLLVVAVVSYI